jgi:hypothetical protein
MSSGASRGAPFVPRPQHRRRSAAEERGAVLVMFACFLPVLLMFVALVVDVGAAFLMKRHLQSAVDAAALAAAQELPNTVDAEGVANEYSASDGGRNVRTSLPVVTTVVSFPEPVGQKVKVTASAKSPLFFAGLFGFEGFDVSATAVASKTSETTGTPLAVYVHELCGASTGNKGFIAAGENMRIEGGIHSNGQFTVGNAGLRSVGPATVYRPSAGSPSGPAQGSCAGTAPLHIQDQSDSSYCTGCPGGALDEPQPALWRDWTTPYHTEDIMKGYTPCTFNHPGDMKYENTTIPSGVHCLPNNKKFTIVGTSSGNITVIGGIIEVGGTGTLEPYNSNHPVLFYSTNTVSTAIKLNPSAAYDWSGYIINRFGGIEINAAGVTTPQAGLLEAEWIHVNGESFTMLGTFAGSSEGSIFGAVRLDE